MSTIRTKKYIFVKKMEGKMRKNKEKQEEAKKLMVELFLFC